MELREDDLLLRPATIDDLPAIVAACQDPELSRFIPGFPSPYTEANARTWLDARPGPDKARTFLIVDGSSGDLYGAIEVRLGGTGSIGYWIAAEARGKGIATRATRLLSSWALKLGGVERLELTTDPANTASQRVAEKAGFTREGILRAHTKFPDGRRDSVMFSRLPADVA